jgi:aspartyl-tRNA(Asn)/glutamyl-tRNA(Gln) amidotransferase subunit B
VFERMLESGKGAAAIVDEAGLGQISGGDELTTIAREVIAANERAVADYRAGKDAAIKFLMGQVMRQTKGRANPQVVQDVLVRELG